MALDKLPYIKTRSPVKVSIVFAVGIILPCVFLSYLGSRSYQYEARLMQKETEERYAAVADLLVKKVEGHLSDFQSALRTIAAQPSLQHLDPAPIALLILSKPSLNGLIPDALFVFDASDHMVAPWHADVSPPAHDTARPELDWGAFTDELERLERLEFVQKDYRAALRGYRALQTKVLAPPLQAALLKNIAGDYRKLHQNRLAEAAYLTLARDHEQLHDFSGYPMGILGRQMAIELYVTDQAWSEALDTRLDLIEGLILHRWAIPDAQRTELLSEHRMALERFWATHPNHAVDRKARWERLRTLQGRLATLERQGERFAKNDWPELLQHLRRTRRFEQGAVFQITVQQTPTIALVAPIFASSNGQRRGLLVALLPAQALWPLLNNVMVEWAQPAGLKVEWDHSRPEVAAARRLWKPTVQRDINGIDPPLHFTLIDAASSTRDQLFHRRQWIFAGMIGLSFMVIIVGLVIMGQAVKRETEVANLKADFVANVSHELRTPLAAISHIGERLSLGRYRSDEERKEFYALLGQETGRLRGLIEDILDFSKMLAGKKVYRQEPLDLAALVHKALQGFAPKAEARGFQIAAQIPSEPVPLLGDARALSQAVLNLLDNALKYSGDSRRIEVTVAKTGTEARVAIRDQGIGIAAADQERIFEKFYRLEKDSHLKDEGGVGLGLAMVKHVIEGHNGKILVDSKVGRGSTFTLVFRLARGGDHGTHSRS